MLCPPFNPHRTSSLSDLSGSAARGNPPCPPSAALPTPLRTITLTLLAMLAFAGNSLLGRLALKYTAIDPASFTSLRLIAGALVLWLIVRLRGGSHRVEGSWLSALALFAYAAAVSFAYISLPAGSGALLLGEALSWRLVLASAAILGGIALVIVVRHR